MSKEQILKQIEGRIDTAQNMMLECIELIYNAGYNDGIEAALHQCDNFDKVADIFVAIRSLKNECRRIKT